jgi:hypothetical protein
MIEGDESTFQQQKHDPNKITKPTEEEWDQSDLRLVNYTQNSHKMLLLKNSGGLVRSGYQTCLVHPENFSKSKFFFPTLILELWDTKLDETWTHESPQHKEYILKRGFPKYKDFPFEFGLAQEN